MKLHDLFLFEDIPQTRVNKGVKTQKSVASSIKHTSTKPVKVLKYAKSGSKTADIIMSVAGERIQIEAKTRATNSTLIKVIEETVKRGQPGVRLFPMLSRLGFPGGVTEYIDRLRDEGKPAGFTGDKGAPASGSIGGAVRITDPAICGSIRKQLIQQLQQSGDNYFAVETSNTGDIDVYFTGLGNNVLNASPIPQIKFALLDTYGAAATIGTVRVAIKAMFP